MGLDMYLEADAYIGGNYEHRKVEGSAELTIDGKPLSIPASQISNITIPVGYWRKANHIHAWFVDTVQNGMDECQRSYVSFETLELLRDQCREVLADRKKAEEMLPVKEGFFFGTYEYDDYYFQDLEETIRIIDECEQLQKDIPIVDFHYQASW